MCLPAAKRPCSPLCRCQALLPLKATPKENQAPGMSREHLRIYSGAVGSLCLWELLRSRSEVAPFETGQVPKGHELSEEAITGNASSSIPKLQTKVLAFVRTYGKTLHPTRVLMPRVTLSLASYMAKKPAGVLSNREEGGKQAVYPTAISVGLHFLVCITSLGQSSSGRSWLLLVPSPERMCFCA